MSLCARHRCTSLSLQSAVDTLLQSLAHGIHLRLILHQSGDNRHNALALSVQQQSRKVPLQHPAPIASPQALHHLLQVLAQLPVELAPAAMSS